MGTETKVGLPELLWATLDIYRDHGGAKRSLRTMAGQVCLVGALQEAERFLEVWGQRNRLDLAAQNLLLTTANEMFAQTYRPSWTYAYRFNDHYATTKEMVETVIEKSAIKASEVVE